jgi:alpha-tubulin suppressor-like RCC1 family protein
MGYTGDGITCTAVNLLTSVFAGMKSVCAQASDGTVKCWGENASGSLGIGDIAARGDGAGEMGANLPILDLGMGKTVQKLSFSGYTACAILNDNTVKCWGDNATGTLGSGDTINRGDDAGEMGDNLPTVNLGTGKTATAISVGSGAACAILNDGNVKCWGGGDFGQTGYGDTMARGDDAGEMGDDLPNVDLGTGKTATAISTFDNTTCAVLNDGSVKCWGKNTNGQLGLGDTVTRGDDASEMGDKLPAVDLGTGKTAVAVSVGGGRVCALLNDASVKCWGSNLFGILGLGDSDDRGDNAGEMGDTLPGVNLGTGKTATAIATGYAHACALLNDSSVKCWGLNSSGQLGLGDTIGRGSAAADMGDNLPAVALGTGKTAVAIGTRGWNTCALLNDGAVKCWGQNDFGQLGQGDTVTRGDDAGEMGDMLLNVTLF